MSCNLFHPQQRILPDTGGQTITHCLWLFSKSLIIMKKVVLHAADSKQFTSQVPCDDKETLWFSHETQTQLGCGMKTKKGAFWHFSRCRSVIKFVNHARSYKMWTQRKKLCCREAGITQSSFADHNSLALLLVFNRIPICIESWTNATHILPRIELHWWTCQWATGAVSKVWDWPFVLHQFHPPSIVCRLPIANIHPSWD